MFNVYEYMLSVLSEIEFPVYFIQRPDGDRRETFITFNYTTENDWFSNDEQETEVYSVTVNFVTKNPALIVPNTEKIKTLLNSQSDITRVIKRGTVYTKELKLYTTIITFKIYK